MTHVAPRAPASVAGRRRRSLVVAPAAPLPRAAPSPQPPISVAERPFPVNQQLVERDARRTLSAIDFSKRDIVIWVQGTGNHGMRPDFEDEVLARWPGGAASLSYLRYPAARDIRPSVGNGVAVLRLVLAAIAARGGDHRVLLAGDSQGAWVLGEAAADPALRPVVTRAVMLGHPWLAAHHEGPGDPAVVEVNKRGDHVTTPMRGSADDAVDAYSAIHAVQLARLAPVVRVALRNPWHLLSLIRTGLSFVPGVRRFAHNTHEYSDLMAAAVAFLYSGDGAALRAAVEGVATISSATADVHPGPPGSHQPA